MVSDKDNFYSISTILLAVVEKIIYLHRSRVEWVNELDTITRKCRILGTFQHGGKQSHVSNVSEKRKIRD